VEHRDIVGADGLVTGDAAGEALREPCIGATSECVKI
jgi:hypothetical protein